MRRFAPVSAYPGDNGPLVKIFSRRVVRSEATVENVLEDGRERLWRESVHRTKGVPNETNLGKDAGRLGVKFPKLRQARTSADHSTEKAIINRGWTYL